MQRKFLRQKLLRALQLLRSQAVYQSVLNLMGDPWGPHKEINVARQERRLYDFTRPEVRVDLEHPEECPVDAVQLRESEIFQMKRLLRVPLIRRVVADKIAAECHFPHKEKAFQNLETAVLSEDKNCVQKARAFASLRRGNNRQRGGAQHW